MKTTVLVLSVLLGVLSVVVLLEHLRSVSRWRLAAGALLMLASTLAMWAILPAEARHTIQSRAGAARIAITGKVAQLAEAWRDDAPRPVARVACKKNEFYSRISKTCVPEWNIKAR